MWEMIAQVALQLLGWFLSARAADAETRKAYLDFIQLMAAQGLVSASLNTSFEAQRQRNRDELAKLNKPSA